jgi:hypothetical protein
MARKNGNGRGGAKTDVTLGDLAREMRAGFNTFSERMDALGDRVDALGDRMESGFSELRTQLGRQHKELIAVIAKSHGLEGRVSKLETEVAVLKRRR